MRFLRGLLDPPPITVESLVKAYYRLTVTAVFLAAIVHSGWSFLWLALAVWDGADWWRLRSQLKAKKAAGEACPVCLFRGGHASWCPTVPE